MDIKIINLSLKIEKTSISVICSRWNEPLGRASLEACREDRFQL